MIVWRLWLCMRAPGACVVKAVESAALDSPPRRRRRRRPHALRAAWSTLSSIRTVSWLPYTIMPSPPSSSSRTSPLMTMPTGTSAFALRSVSDFDRFHFSDSDIRAQAKASMSVSFTLHHSINIIINIQFHTSPRLTIPYLRFKVVYNILIVPKVI